LLPKLFEGVTSVEMAETVQQFGSTSAYNGVVADFQSVRWCCFTLLSVKPLCWKRAPPKSVT